MRRTSQQIDEDIVDVAASVFARHGFKQAPLQAVADATGYSKAAILKRFASKEALQAAVIEAAFAHVASVRRATAALPPGPEQDRAVVTELVDLAERRPGFVALTLSAVSTNDPELAGRLDPVIGRLYVAFGVVEHDGSARFTRVTAVLGALAVTALSLGRHPHHETRADIIAVCCAALWAP